MYDRKTLVISAEDMEPTAFHSMRKAAKATSVSCDALRYTKDNENDFIKKDGKIFEIKWC